jgi:hypothetical protein
VIVTDDAHDFTLPPRTIAPPRNFAEFAKIYVPILVIAFLYVLTLNHQSAGIDGGLIESLLN